jgi:hypothetical protein
MAQKHDFVIDQGSRLVLVFKVTVGWLSDLSGYSARGMVRESQTIDGPVIADFAAYLSVDVAQDFVILDLPANISAAYDWEVGHYDMEIFDGNPAHDVRFVQGQIRVDKESTHG